MTIIFFMMQISFIRRVRCEQIIKRPYFFIQRCCFGGIRKLNFLKKWHFPKKALLFMRILNLSQDLKCCFFITNRGAL